MPVGWAIYFFNLCYKVVFSCFSHETDSADNCLVECHECHNYYHQRCHKPPMTNKDVHDPRFVLYCSQCSRKVKKEIVRFHYVIYTIVYTLYRKDYLYRKTVAVLRMDLQLLCPFQCFIKYFSNLFSSVH